MYGWVILKTPAGNTQGVVRARRHPFWNQRKLWCRLEVQFNGVDLVFAMPQELDHFLAVMSRKVMPSGASLIPGRASPGRPNNHWLSRLPSKAKPYKFRQALCRYLGACPEAQKFRDFYEASPVCISFDGFHDSVEEARRAPS